MKNNVAFIIEQMAEITKHAPVKKELQKTVFLIEKKGVSLGYKYMLHFYGPYCAELDHETMVLNAKGVIDFQYDQYGHKMSVADEYKDVACEDLTELQQQTIKDVIERYKGESVSFLELLTTAIYVYDYTGAKTRQTIRSNVKQIKGEKYSDREINKAIDEFSFFEIAVPA